MNLIIALRSDQNLRDASTVVCGNSIMSVRNDFFSAKIAETGTLISTWVSRNEISDIDTQTNF